MNRDLYPFQREGVKHLICFKRALLGDVMGAGKTVQALIAAKKVKKRKVMVVSPKNVKLNWVKEIETWCPEWKIKVLNVVNDLENVDLNWDIVVLHYDILSGINAKKRSKSESQQLFYSFYKLTRLCDILIFDEAHYLKNPRSLRTRVVKGVLKKYKGYVWFLTGTPFNGKPEDLYGLLRIIWPDEDWGRHFLKREYRNFYIWYIFDEEGLIRKMKLKGFLRRTKDEILHFLPKKVRIPLYMKAYDQNVWLDILKKKFDSDVFNFSNYKIWEILDAVSKDTSKKNLRFLADQLGVLGRYKEFISYLLVLIGAARQVAWELKKEWVFSLIKDFLENIDKLVIFTCFRDSFKDIASFLNRAKIPYVGYTGESSAKEREEAIIKFQTTDVPIFLATLKAANVGINLTASHTLLMAELDWDINVIKQGEDRLHRIGQESNVFIYYPIINNSFEVNILETLMRKDKLEAIMDENKGDRFTLN